MQKFTIVGVAEADPLNGFISNESPLAEAFIGHKKGEEVENYDKEVMRIWFKEHNYSGKGKPPKMPTDLIVKVAERYMEVYEKLSGQKFAIDLSTLPRDRVIQNLSKLI